MKHLLLNNKIILIKALISLKMLKMTTWWILKCKHISQVQAHDYLTKLEFKSIWWQTYFEL
jgi:hypothetical protein